MNARRDMLDEIAIVRRTIMRLFAGVHHAERGAGGVLEAAEADMLHACDALDMLEAMAPEPDVREVAA